MSNTSVIFECPSFTLHPQDDGSTKVTCPFFVFESSNTNGAHSRIQFEGLEMSFKAPDADSEKEGRPTTPRYLANLQAQINQVLQGMAAQARTPAPPVG